MKFDQTFKALFVLHFILANIILYIVYKFTKRFKIFHAVVSTIDNLALIAFVSVAAYQANHYFVLIIPCVLPLIYTIYYGLNTSLTDDEKAMLVYSKGLNFLIPPKVKKKIKITFLELFTFPFYYVVESWKQIFSKE